MEYRDKDFTGQTVELDGNTFTGCTFRQCRLVFTGVSPAPLLLNANHMKEGVEWVFEGPAQRTIAFMSALYQGNGEAGKKLVEQTFENIRRGGR